MKKKNFNKTQNKRIQKNIEFYTYVNEYDFTCYNKYNYKVNFFIENSITLMLGFNKQVYNYIYLIKFTIQKELLTILIL